MTHAFAPGLTTLYVDPRGSDAWSGGLAAPNRVGFDGPLATLARALELAWGRPARVLLRGGCHRTELRITAGALIAAYPGERPLLTGETIVAVRGLQVDGVALEAVRLEAAEYGTFINCRISGPVTVDGGRGNRLLGCVIDGDVQLGGEVLLADCIVRGRLTVAADDCRVRHNHLGDCTVHPGAGAMLEYNRMGTLALHGGQPGAQVRGNVIAGGICAEGCAGALIEDNLVDGGYRQRGGRDNVLRNNILAGGIAAATAPWFRPLLLEGNILSGPVHADRALCRRNFTSSSSPLSQHGARGPGGEGARGSAQDESTCATSIMAMRDDHPAFAYGFGPLDPGLAGPRLADVLPDADAWEADDDLPAPILACRLEPAGINGYRLVVDNRGTVIAVGEIALHLLPEDAGHLLGDDIYPVQLAPGETVVFTGHFRRQADLLLETLPRGEGILPTALYFTGE